MFGNFIYFIIVLLIYITYQPSDETNFAPLETLFLFLFLIILFGYFTWFQFHRLERRISKASFSSFDHIFNAIIFRLSIMAIIIFAIDIYVLNLTSFLTNISLFSIIPTLQALLFLGLFVLYLAIIWAFAYGSYRLLYKIDISRKSYIFSNISFSIPVLLPWFFLSGITDIINALPFELPKRLLSTTEGEVIYFLVFLVAVAMLGPVLIQKFWRCKPLETGSERSRIERLCKTAGIGYANIMYWPIFGGRMITAGVMGLVKKFRYILVTDALLRFLEPEEIDSVIAHEIGHVKRKHLLFYLVFFIGYLFLSYAIFDLIIYTIIYAEPIYRFIGSAGFNQAAVTSAMFSLAIILIFLVYFRYIFGYFMRNFERQADIYVYALFDSAKPLISTLEKIAVTSGQPPDKPNWHHFSITERKDYLGKCEKDKTWINRHERKMRKSIAIYLVGIILIGGVAYNLNFGETGKKLNKHLFEKILLRELQKTPDNSNLLTTLGDLYYSINDYEKTIHAYQKSIKFKSDNPRALNNLAWLYATCDDIKFRDPIKALELAQRAVELQKAAHILDTLAESYYINGKYEEAVYAEKLALELAKKDRFYYKKQLNKFRKAAGKIDY